jgi:hypothetical protein
LGHAVYTLPSLRTTARFGPNSDEGRRVRGGESDYKGLVGASLIGESMSALSIEIITKDLVNKRLLRRQIQGVFTSYPNTAKLAPPSILDTSLTCQSERN